MDFVTTLVAIVGSGGLGAVLTAVINSIALSRKGIRGQEDARTADIVKQRDMAWDRVAVAEADADSEEARADRERAMRIQTQEQVARLRLQLINLGVEPITTK